MSAYQRIDPAVLMNAAGDDAQGFRELLAMFLRIVPEMAQALHDAVRDERADAIAHQAHSIKSCMSLVGALGCSARLEAIERNARQGGADCADLFVQLEGELAAVIVEARHCYAATGPHDESALPE
jgi:HPt (histidine-containing phosphotransfer) domain-containing protein